jgi:hypothetical protein
MADRVQWRCSAGESRLRRWVLGMCGVGVVAVVETGVLRYMKPVDWIDGKG